jgi:hypothetical protein
VIGQPEGFPPAPIRTRHGRAGRQKLHHVIPLTLPVSISKPTVPLQMREPSVATRTTRSRHTVTPCPGDSRVAIFNKALAPTLPSNPFQAARPMLSAPQRQRRNTRLMLRVSISKSDMNSGSIRRVRGPRFSAARAERCNLVGIPRTVSAKHGCIRAGCARDNRLQGVFMRFNCPRLTRSERSRICSVTPFTFIN